MNPSGKVYLHMLAAKVFVPLLTNQSVLLESVQKSGVHAFALYLIQQPQSLNSQFASDSSKINFLGFDAKQVADDYSVEDIQGLFTNLAAQESRPIKEILADIKQTTAVIVKNAQNLLNSPKAMAVFINLYSANPAVRFAFVCTRQLSTVEKKQFNTDFAIRHNHALPLKGATEMQILIDKEITWGNVTIGKKEAAKIVELSGGYSSLARSLLVEYAKDPKSFMQHTLEDFIKSEDVLLRCSIAYESLLPESQRNCLKHLLKLECNDKYLHEVEIIRGENFFSELFEKYIEKLYQQSLKWQIESDKIYASDLQIDPLLSPQENNVLRLLVSNQNTLVSKDEIAKLIWGDNFQDKYSDWAIDTLIKSIRQKLHLSKSANLVTVKGKGYELR